MRQTRTENSELAVARRKRSAFARALRLLGGLLVAAFALEVAYLAVGNLLLERRLAALEARTGTWLQVNGLWTLYPGDLRAHSLVATRHNWRLEGKRVRGRFGLAAALGDVTRVEQLSANLVGLSVTHATLGDLELRGLLRLELQGLELDAVGGDDTPLEETLSARGQLNGQFSSTRPTNAVAPSLAPRDLAVDASWQLRHGQLTRGALELSSASDSGSTTALNWTAPRGWRLSVQVPQHDANEAIARAQLRSERLLLTLQQSAARGPLQMTLEPTLDLSLALADWDSAGFNDATGTLQIANIERQGTLAPHESLDDENPDNENPDAHATLSFANVRWNAVTGLEFRGNLEAQGPDTSLLLTLLRLEPGLTWSLSELEGEPFRLSAAVEYQPAALMLQQLRVESGHHTLQGAVCIHAGERDVALRLRRGQLTLGLLASAESTALEFKPGPEWLERTVQPLETTCGG